MAISTNAVFHYTNSIDHLLTILRRGFYPSYCKEKLVYGKKEYNYLIPMIFFCDIPLNQIGIHTEKYGSFAIGLTSEWAVNNGLNPVLYVEKNSRLAIGIEKTISFIFKNWHEVMDDIDFDEFYDNAYKGSLNVIYSLKNFEGKLERNKKLNIYKFYDEREWRYVPSIKSEDEEKYPDIIWEDDFQSFKMKFPNKPHFDSYGITISANDIKYLIVESETQVIELIKELKEMKHLYSTEDQYNLLLTKISTFSRFKEDF